MKTTKNYYAHEGSSNDNAFTTDHGMPTRVFRVFKSKQEREEYRKKIWMESNHQTNLIDCTRLFVEKWNGKNFVVSNGVVYTDVESIEIA